MAAKKKLTNLTKKAVSKKAANQVRGGRKAGAGQRDFLK